MTKIFSLVVHCFSLYGNGYYFFLKHCRSNRIISLKSYIAAIEVYVLLALSIWVRQKNSRATRNVYENAARARAAVILTNVIIWPIPLDHNDTKGSAVCAQSGAVPAISRPVSPSVIVSRGLLLVRWYMSSLCVRFIALTASSWFIR